jgi:hypothetical protein
LQLCKCLNSIKEKKIDYPRKGWVTLRAKHQIALTTTITKGAKEKLLPSLAEMSTANRFRSRKQQISTRIPVDHCRISCNLKSKVYKPCIYLSIVNYIENDLKMKGLPWEMFSNGRLLVGIRIESSGCENLSDKNIRHDRETI